MNLWDIEPWKLSDEQIVPGETIPAMYSNAVAQRGERVWLRQKVLGVWRSWSWNQTATAVREIAMGLASIGFRPGECAGVLSNTVVEWLLVDLGVQSAGGVTNGIYPTGTGAQVEYLCVDSRTTVLFVEDDEQLDKVLEVRERLPLLMKIVVFDMEGLAQFSDPMVMSLAALRVAGASHDLAAPGLYDQLRSCRGPGDVAILVYTSGTTGKPKGAMHSHGGLVYTARAVNHLFPQTESDERICFLPLCHIAERVIGAYASLYTGAKLNFAERPDTIAENVREIAPTVLFAVPRVWEKFYSAVTIGIQEASRVQQLAYRWAIGVGNEVAERVLAAEPIDGWLRLRFLLARQLALDNVRKLIGVHRARLLLTGAAPISPDLIRWYLALGLPMLEGWALTESCALGTFTLPWRMKPGTIGQAAAGIEVRVDERSGELLIRGSNVFMGYLNQPELTAQTIDADGWLHTGDVGVADLEGYFRITDRMKDIIITAGGKNVTPSELENDLKFSPYITDAVVIGDRRAYLTAIVMVDHENVEKYAQEHAIPFSNYASLTRAAEIQALIWAEIEKVNKKVARVEQVKKFYLLDKQLTAEDEELTPTMKLKRKLVESKYADHIESMYQ